MSFVFPPPPPPPPLTTADGGATTITLPKPQYSDVTSGEASSPQSPSASIIIVIILVASAIIVSASIYLLLLFVSRRCRSRSFSSTAADDVVISHSHHHRNNSNGDADCFEERRVAEKSLFESLPLFTFGSVTGNLTSGDCAVCLSKFEAHDQLRLLPLCCHAFHARCIDTWLSSNLTCPLCRSSVNPTDSEVFSKILSAETIRSNNSGNANDNNNVGGSFRIEIGSVSRRRGASDSGRRSYSIGSFEYIVDDGYEVSVGSTHTRGLSECTSVDKESVGVPVAAAPPGESLAEDVSGGRSWLRDYVDRLGSFSFSSRTMSFRSSGRFFTGSSRRSDVVVPVEDLEASRIGEEISELFRWFSGV